MNMNKQRRAIAHDHRSTGSSPVAAGAERSVAVCDHRSIGRGRVLLNALMLLVMCALAARAQETNFAPEELSLDELMVHASRYGTTQSKRERKKQSHDELMNRKAAALEYLVNHTYIENMWFFIYGHELNQKLDDREAVPVLLDALASSQSNVVRTAAYFLGFHQAPEQADRLLSLLDNEFTAGTAIRTLGKWQCVQAVPQIIPFLKNEKERRRIVAANALRDIDDPRAIPALINALDDPFFTVRNAAARALVQMGAEAQPALLEILDQTDGLKQRQIIRTLSDMRATAAIQPLEKLRDDADDATRNDVIIALERIRTGEGPLFFIHGY